MRPLADNATLGDLQFYVAQSEAERGFSEETTLQKCLLLGEEVGELFKAIRKHEGLALDPDSVTTPISEELADILFYLCAVANRYEIDLAEAFREKERINETRFWKAAV
ncbi:MazG nucleotide pyrophosphohydrolase domain-containing protein [Agrobacterium sp. 22-221-1]